MPTFTISTAVAAGVARRTLYRLRDEGLIFEVSRGVYRRADAPETAYVDLLAVAKRVPKAVVCLVSALAIHELTDDVPPAIQLALPAGTGVPCISYPAVKFSRFASSTFSVGMEMFEASPNEYVMVYNAERAVADAMRLRHLVGDDVAYRALRAYLSRRSSDPVKLTHTARVLGNPEPLIRAIEVVMS